jgi:hypothetical protein
LAETDNRIVLWRNTIQLFHTYRKVNFNGPFFTSGYTNYRVESPLSEKTTGKSRVPDIFACGPQGWLVIDLTLNTESKKEQLDSYKNLDSRSLSVYGCQAYATSPDTMSSRLTFNSDGDHCEMVVMNTFDLKKEQFIHDVLLRDALIGMKGQNMKKLPEIPFSLVPEMKHYEIRRGLIDIVMQLFDTKSEGKTPYQMCEEGLERLFELVTPTSRQSLIDKIKQEMDVLVKKDLAGYLVLNEGKYCATGKFKQYPKSRLAVASKLQEWANPTQRTMADY